MDAPAADQNTGHRFQFGGGGTGRGKRRKRGAAGDDPDGFDRARYGADSDRLPVSAKAFCQRSDARVD